MKNKLVIITGTNKGLGMHLLIELLAINHLKILCLSRKKIELYEHPSIIYYPIDFAEPNDFSFLENLITDYSEVLFINNAGTIEPIALVGSLLQEDVKSAISVNLTSPILIINEILRISSNKKVTIVNITSGAASRIIVGWSVYSIGKLGLKSFLSHLSAQCEENVNVLNIDPGTVDTGMQEAIQRASVSKFPDVQKFRDFKKKNMLREPKVVAREIIGSLKF
ncbi:MAG: SDR family NAD(P)-dependent oxidoreductase [Cyclobacteriaceae bacterium]